MSDNLEADAGDGGAGAPPDPGESNRAPDLTREYHADGITVRWYAKRCIHAAACVRTSPRAFDPRRRPWIDLGRTDFDTIVRAVEACPTGALEYVRADGAGEAVGSTTVQLHPGGPYLVRGNVTVTAEDGSILRRGTRVALCRCGKSANKPFCDNSHRASNAGSQ